jgi:hypothetical protein
VTELPQVDLTDDSFVVGAQAEVAARLRDPGLWHACWPGVRLKTYHDRGVEGVRWYASGAVVGTAELWLEPYRDGTLVHVFLRADPARRLSPRRLDRLRRGFATALKAAVFAAKDDIEAGRPLGTPRVGTPTLGTPTLGTPRVGAARVSAGQDTRDQVSRSPGFRAPDGGLPTPDHERPASSAELSEVARREMPLTTRETARFRHR